MNSQFRRKALLYNDLGNSAVQCNTCWHKCVIKEGKHGRCKTRINIRGILLTEIYGMVSSLSINPIEKKPLFHYYPGSYALTIGSISCNYSCPWCQNWSISKCYPTEVHFPNFLSPEELVEQTEKNSKINGISVSFNEPTLSLEFSLDVFRLCKPETYRSFVTNGYMTDQALKLLIESGMTGMTVTVKGNSNMVEKYCETDVEKVWNNIKIAYREGLHVEIVCLIIPTVNDSVEFYKEVAKRLTDINQNIPLHFTRFFPDYQFTRVDATPIKTLEEAHEVAQSEGVNFVYLGNVPGHPLENTYCSNCQSLLIKRSGYHIEKKFDIQIPCCPSCGIEIPLYLN
ncbi:MAG: AmmeMemoRadiSam system radical SAM enzyme [Candidatus Hodarchaeales archaeon]|jgi:pyruvate formate lyase activating enzyme